MTEGLDGSHHRLAGEHGLHPFLVDAEQIEELRQVRRVPFTAQIGFRNADVAAAQQARGKAEMVDFHGRGRSRTDAAQPDRAPIGQGYIERTAPELGADAKGEPDHAGEVGQQRIHSIRCD